MTDQMLNYISQDNKIKVIGIYGKDKIGKKLYEYECTICSHDKELFPNPFFATKHQLINNIKTCGCVKHKRWTYNQYQILLHRAFNNKYKIINQGTYNERLTEITLHCPEHDETWKSEYRKTLKAKTQCKKCLSKINSENKGRTPQEDFAFFNEKLAENNLRLIMIDKQHNKIGFICEKHNFEIQYATRKNFLGQKRGSCQCTYCSTSERYSFGFYPEKIHNIDYLYIININDEYIKIGRSFDIKRRIQELKQKDKNICIELVTSIQGLHYSIYKLEQSIHDQLRKNNLQYKNGI